MVDVNVNGQYYYGDCPVSGNGARYPHETPMLYNYFTAKNYYTDPFLFIEDDSGIPGKIIAWNNDYSGSGDFFWGLNARVKKDFSVRVGAGLISSFRSWFDNGTCDLYLKCQNSNIMGSWCDLEADDAIQSAPYSPAYNCASWGGGRIDLGRYFWASDSPYSNNKSSDWYVAPYQYPYYYTVEEAFWKSWNNFFGNTPPRFVGAPNYTRSGAYSYNAEIAMFGTSSSIYDYEHVAVTKPGNDQPHGYDWESKPGANMRTFHPRDAIGGDLYGSIQTYYRRSSSLKTTYSFEESVALGLTILPEIYISNEESNKIEKLKELINTSVKYDFEIKFSALLEKSQSPELKLYSNPIHIYESIEFKQLLTLCNEKSKKILPFLFEKVFEKGSAESNELAAIVLNEITTEYSALMEEVKEEYKNNCYTFNGAYIAPSPMNNTKKFIKKLLNLYDLHTGEIENVEISKENHIGIIDNFEIFSMYPNPFKQYTNIKFMLLDDSYISLNVYNLNGEIVCTLINNEERNAGEHTLEWAPDNLSSGLYICRLEVNSKVYNRRFLIEE